MTTMMMVTMTMMTLNMVMIMMIKVRSVLECFDLFIRKWVNSQNAISGGTQPQHVVEIELGLLNYLLVLVNNVDSASFIAAISLKSTGSKRLLDNMIVLLIDGGGDGDDDSDGDG